MDLQGKHLVGTPSGMEHALQRFLAASPPFLCVRDGQPLAFDRNGSWACAQCGHRVSLVNGYTDVVDLRDQQAAAVQQNQKIAFAYRFYSLVYPVVALLAMKLVWKGSLRHLIRFYREELRDAAGAQRPFLDVATGDGSLTQLCLKKVPGAPDFVAVDLSQEMLAKASKRFRKHPGKMLCIADISQLPMPEGSFSHILCYGGIHVFADPHGALQKMRRLLLPGGRLSGSYLMRPLRPWADQFVDWGVTKGLLSNSLDEKHLDELFHGAGFEYVRKEHNGRQLLFALTPRV